MSRDMEPNRARRLWAGATVLLLIAIGVVLIESRSPEESVVPEPPEPPEPIVQPEPLREPEPIVVPGNPDGDAVLAHARPGLSAHAIARFQGKGLEDPVGDILRDLTTRVDLIPHEGVHGGTMYIVTSDSYVLTDRWALVTYEDGHIRGRMLAEYAVNEDGTITWWRIDAYLE